MAIALAPIRLSHKGDDILALIAREQGITEAKALEVLADWPAAHPRISPAARPRVINGHGKA